MLLTALLYAPLAAQATEGGGTSGADFLLAAPATRSDAMGGAIDAYGNNLEPLLLNPSLMTSLESFKVQLNMNPLPNDVSHITLGVGIPLFGGVGGVSAQLFNVGQFTTVSESGQPLNTVSIFDAAVGLAYSYPFWDTFSVGLNLKGIYRVLGDYTAFSFGGDIGTSFLFELPHFGQAPKAPTYEQMEKVFLREMAALDRRKEQETADATKRTAELTESIEKANGKVVGLSEKVRAEEDPEKKQTLNDQREVAEEELLALEDELRTARVTEAETLVEIEDRYRADVARAKQDFDERVADVNAIQNEREKLFAVVTDPDTELEDNIIDENIDESILRTQEFLSDRIRAYQEGELLFRQKRFTRTVELEQELQQYNDQIDAELGPAFERVSGEIEALLAQIGELTAKKTASEEAETKAVEDRKVAAEAVNVIDKAATEAAKAAEDAGKENTEAGRFAQQIEGLVQEQEELTVRITELNQEQAELLAQIRELEQQVKAKEDERDALEADPWIRRLRRRVEDKQKEIDAIAAEIEQNARDTDNEIARTDSQAQSDIQTFEALRAMLKRELKRAKLKRELDGVDAITEQALETANTRYEETESQLFQQLLAAMYSNEEKLFQARISAIRLDSEDRKFDYETEYQKSLEFLEEEFAFQERFLRQKINELRRDLKAAEAEAKAKAKAKANAEAKDESDENPEAATAAEEPVAIENPELTAAEEELAEKEADYQAALTELDKKRQEHLNEERDRVRRETAAVRMERTRIRLVFLQTDDPFRNTSASLAFRNIGTPIKFAAEEFHLPMMMSAGLSYTVLNIDNHLFRISMQADVPLLVAEGVPFYQDISVGVGVEYSFFNLAFVRAGYTFNNIERTFAAGFGVRLGLGFTEYTVDYTFRPLPDYGFVHSFGVSISF